MVGINLLLWLCYFSHILSFGLALLAIAILWLATLRRDNWRRHLLHVAVLAPQGFLPVWYFSMEGGAPPPPSGRSAACCASSSSSVRSPASVRRRSC